MIRWRIISFAELTAIELYEILRLRAEIFVVEQKCAYQDIDNYDLNAVHILAHDNDKLIAYARILPAQSKYPHISIGRVAVLQSHRGRGLARELLQRCLDHLARQQPGQAILAQSQCYLENFYAGFGFKAVGAPYEDDGVMHVDMLRG